MTEARSEYAFPVSSIDGYTQSGMTLRDYFAAKVMQALISASGMQIVHPEEVGGNREYTPEEFAQTAYIHADAMLAERIK